MPPRPIQASAAVERARQRRVAAAGREKARIEWFIKEVSENVEMTMKQRVRLATDLVKNQVIKNISIPVTKSISPITGRVIVTERSKPGEFPRADTTQLMKTIFSVLQDDKNGTSGYVGTPLDYGLILEVQMNRSFLVRTIREELTKIRAILTGPIKGGSSRGFGFGVGQ